MAMAGERLRPRLNQNTNVSDRIDRIFQDDFLFPVQSILLNPVNPVYFHLLSKMKRLTKQEMVLEIYDREAMGEVTAREIAVINQALMEEFGEGGAMAPAEIARILHDEDLPVRFEQIFRMESPTDKYENLFGGLSKCGTLAEAEGSLRQID